jgi:hypothetical protein
VSEYFFGSGNGKIKPALAARIHRIAVQHGAHFVSVTVPGDGPRYWFTCPNRGNPFDQAIERAVWDALESEGLAHDYGVDGPDDVAPVKSRQLKRSCFVGSPT